jgi:protein phosphatase
LTEHIEDHEMAEALLRYPPQQACEALVQTTLSRGAKDNVTVVIVRCLDRQAAYNAAPQPGHRASGGDEWHVDA